MTHRLIFTLQFKGKCQLELNAREVDQQINGIEIVRITIIFICKRINTREQQFLKFDLH